MTWVHDVPIWVAGFGTIMICVVFSLVGLYIKQRTVHHLPLNTALIDNGVVGWFFSSIMVLYSVTLGLVAVATWQRMTDASGISSREAASIAALYRDVSGYPSPLKETAQQQLRDYTTTIIQQEWPAQRRGQVSTAGSIIMTQLQQTLFALQPENMAQQAIEMETLRQFNILVDLHRQRIDTVNSGIPGVLWVVVLGGAAIMIFFSFAFAIEEIRLHAAMTVGLAMTIGLLIFMIAVLDEPYRGSVSIDSTEYEMVLGTVLQPTSTP